MDITPKRALVAMKPGSVEGRVWFQKKDVGGRKPPEKSPHNNVQSSLQKEATPELMNHARSPVLSV